MIDINQDHPQAIHESRLRAAAADLAAQVGDAVRKQLPGLDCLAPAEQVARISVSIDDQGWETIYWDEAPFLMVGPVRVEKDEGNEAQLFPTRDLKRIAVIHVTPKPA